MVHYARAVATILGLLSASSSIAPAHGENVHEHELRSERRMTTTGGKVKGEGKKHKKNKGGSSGMKSMGKKKKKKGGYNNLAEAQCKEYCELYGKVCVDDDFFEVGCVEDCLLFPLTDTDPVYDANMPSDPIDLGSDTLACRSIHLSFAITFGGGGDLNAARQSPDAAFHCGHASPGGEGICTDYKVNDGLQNPFRLMQNGGNYKFGACRITKDHTVANCMRSGLDDAAAEEALKLLPRTVQNIFLHRNDLTAVPAEVKKFPHLKSLYLDGNDIASVAKADFHGLHKLEILSLNVNPVVSLPADLLYYTPYLKTFSYFNAPGSTDFDGAIPAAFFQHTKGIVNIIMYNHVNLSEFQPGTFNGLNKCEIISFVGCSLTFPGLKPDSYGNYPLFKDLVSLQYFDFFGNQFAGDVPAKLLGPWASNVFRVVFWANHITGIEPYAFKYLANVKKIFFHAAFGTNDVDADDIHAAGLPTVPEVITL